MLMNVGEEFSEGEGYWPTFTLGNLFHVLLPPSPVGIPGGPNRGSQWECPEGHPKKYPRTIGGIVWSSLKKQFWEHLKINLGGRWGGDASVISGSEIIFKFPTELSTKQTSK